MSIYQLKHELDIFWIIFCPIERHKNLNSYKMTNICRYIFLKDFKPDMTFLDNLL